MRGSVWPHLSTEISLDELCSESDLLWHWGQFSPRASFPLLCAGGSACYLVDSSQPPGRSASAASFTHVGYWSSGTWRGRAGPLTCILGTEYLQGHSLGFVLYALTCQTPGEPHPHPSTVPRACGFHPQRVSSQAPLPPAPVPADVTAHLVCFWAPLAVPSGAFSGLPSPSPHPHFLPICTSLRFHLQTGSQLLPLLCTAAVPSWVPASVFCPFDDCQGLLAVPPSRSLAPSTPLSPGQGRALSELAAMPCRPSTTLHSSPRP